MSTNWAALLIDQLDFYMTAHLLPRLADLTDAEFFWEPVEGCWSIRHAENGAWVIESSWPDPEPSPPPVTTIGWRLAHIAVSNLGSRANAFFGSAERGDAGRPDDRPDMFDPRYLPDVPGTADEAVSLLRQMYQQWRKGILSMDDLQLVAPIGSKGGHFATAPMAVLVLHVTRETIHHGGEIGLLRDLYRHRSR